MKTKTRIQFTVPAALLDKSIPNAALRAILDEQAAKLVDGKKQIHSTYLKASDSYLVTMSVRDT